MRYLPLTDADRRAMLAAIGVNSIDDLFAEVPKPAQHEGLLDLPRAMGELEVERRLGAMAAKNTVARSFSAPAAIATMCLRRSIT
jgi:glycine dehydrogenase subunit 1